MHYGPLEAQPQQAARGNKIAPQNTETKGQRVPGVKKSVADHQTGAARFAAQGSEKDNVHWEDQIIVYVQIP